MEKKKKKWRFISKIKKQGRRFICDCVVDCSYCFQNFLNMLSFGVAETNVTDWIRFSDKRTTMWARSLKEKSAL